MTRYLLHLCELCDITRLPDLRFFELISENDPIPIEFV